MPKLSPEQAYPGIAFRPRSRNWWARLTRVPPECIHLETQHDWMATLVPDTLYLRGRASSLRRPARPEVSLCRACLLGFLEPQLAGFGGRVVAFEPDGESFTQYFFVARLDFEAAGVEPAVACAVELRLAVGHAACERDACSRPARWLWLSRREVVSLDEHALIAAAPGLRLCPAHGAAELCRCLGAIAEANLFYVNLPYGEAGAYLWI